MEKQDALQKAQRNKANYLKAKELFNQNKVDECVLFYAPDHEVKSKQSSSKGREGIQEFLESMHETWADIQITVEHVVAEDDWVMGRSIAEATHSKTVLGVAPTGKKSSLRFGIYIVLTKMA